MTSDAKWVIAVLGGGLGSLTVASHLLLTGAVADVGERLTAVEVRQARAVPRPVPSYSDGTTTFGSMMTSTIEVTAPDGTELSGTFEVDLIAGLLEVTSDDVSKGLASRERPPRGKRKEEVDEYDVRLPELAPSSELLRKLKDRTISWERFLRSYRAEMRRPERKYLIPLFAALSKVTSLSIGCYCEDESQCHRQVLRELLADAGAELA